MESFSFNPNVDRLRALNVKRPRPHKPRTERPDPLQKLFRRRHVKQSVHYFTSGRAVDAALCPTFGANPPIHTPYWFPAEHEEFSYKILRRAWQERERVEANANARYDTRHSHRTRQTMNLAERLHVDAAADDMGDVPGMLDVDPDFFAVVAGRPNADHTTMLEYRATVKETLKTRLRAYYLLDDALKIDENFVAEQRSLDELRAELKTYADSYEEYLARDHKQSMDMLRLSELNFKISQARQKVHKRLDRDVGRCKSRIIILEERWRTLKVYQRFLYEISPLDWRTEFDYVHRTPGGSLDLAPRSLYGDRRELGSAESLDQLVANYHADVADEQKPLLYFDDPHQVLDIFAYMEAQNLNSLLHVEDVLVPLEELRSWIAEAKRKLHNEFGHIEVMISDVETAIADEELRARTLQAICRDYLYGLFRALVSADDALDLHVFIEDVYIHCVAPNDTNLSMLDMMKRLEVETEAVMLQIDHLPVALVRKVQRRVFAEKERIMHEAAEADKKLHIMEIMLRGLARAMAPPYKRVGKPMMVRSEPPPPGRERGRTVTPISSNKMEILQFFTDYCRHTDGGAASQNLPDVSGLNFD